jgi:hypothetical protein
MENVDLRDFCNITCRGITSFIIQSPPISEIMLSCKCFPNVSKITTLKYKRANSANVDGLNIIHINVHDNNLEYLIKMYLIFVKQ